MFATTADYSDGLAGLERALLLGLLLACILAPTLAPRTGDDYRSDTR